MNQNDHYRIANSIIFPGVMLLMVMIMTQCNFSNKTSDSSVNSSLKSDISKQKGTHVFGRIDTCQLDFLKRNYIEWATIVTWAFQDYVTSSEVIHHDRDSLHIVENDKIWVEEMNAIHAAGYKIFVKPHIWIENTSDGKWRSDIYPESEKDWETWNKSYRTFIIRYAKLAELCQAEMFCIGTELTRISIEKPAFWRGLIREVRSVYSGKITYAANWYQEYENINFWSELDYIGIQAYFPLTENEYPSVQQISKGWEKFIPAIKSIHKKYNRPIIFTEMGYKSTSDAGMRPWEWVDHLADSPKSISNETQANCYEAFFKTVWPFDWLEGVHIWQMRGDYDLHRRSDFELDFTPQGKPAEQIIAKAFEVIKE